MKCRAQANNSGFVIYSEAIPKLVAEEGYGALYKGFNALLMRDFPGWGTYFYSYEWLQKLVGIK